MNAEFQWWLLILGVVVGGALVYLVLADMHEDQPAGDDPTEADKPSMEAGDAPAVDAPAAASSTAGREQLDQDRTHPAAPDWGEGPGQRR